MTLPLVSAAKLPLLIQKQLKRIQASDVVAPEVVNNHRCLVSTLFGLLFERHSVQRWSNKHSEPAGVKCVGLLFNRLWTMCMAVDWCVLHLLQIYAHIWIRTLWTDGGDALLFGLFLRGWVWRANGWQVEMKCTAQGLSSRRSGCTQCKLVLGVILAVSCNVGYTSTWVCHI